MKSRALPAARRSASHVIGLPVVAALRLTRTVLRYDTVRAPQFIDITADVERIVASARIDDGIVTVFSMHTTAAIKINEHEPELLKDLTEMLASVAPQQRVYFHNDFSVRSVNLTEDECPNGHAHCQHLLLGTSETIPLMNSRLMLGRWQRVFLIELDHARPRDVVVTVLGCDTKPRSGHGRARGGRNGHR